jgi:hypothetical protein
MTETEYVHNKIRNMVADIRDMLTDSERKLQNDFYKTAFEELAWQIESNLSEAQSQYNDIKEAGLSISLIDAEGYLRNAMYISNALKLVKENLENEQDN